MRKNKIYKIIILSALAIVTLASLAILRHQKIVPKYNILLITLDACRADHLGCYGYRRNTSPNIDNLAKEGVLFTQAISQGAETLNSLASLLTSNYPHRYWGQRLSTLPSLLKKINYSTGLINGYDRLLFEEAGFIHGFNSWNADNVLLTANEVTRRAINFLNRNKNKRFFLWLHYFDPHGPYRPPEPYNKKYLYDSLYKQDKNIPISTDNKNIYSSVGTIPLYIAEKGITDVNYYIAQYDGEISFTDEQIGILLKKIEALSLAKKTIIILTADHGEYMGEHNIYFTHGKYPYDAVIRVPLIFKCKDIFPAGKIIDEQVGHIDILPTILGILKLKTKIKMEGINLMPYILNQQDYFPRNIVFTEVTENQGKVGIISLRHKQWKLIYNGREDNYELYNLKNDPQELNNLVSIEKEQFEFLKQKLDVYRLASLQKQNKITKPMLDEDTKERLRSLGYVQ